MLEHLHFFRIAACPMMSSASLCFLQHELQGMAFLTKVVRSSGQFLASFRDGLTRL